EHMRDGKVVHHRFTIVEGWNIRELRAALARATPLVQTLHEVDDAALMATLGREGVHPEGRFLPETYAYDRGDSDVDLLRRAAADLDRALDAAWQARADDLPIHTPEEALVLASIVEKETGIAEERPMIAGVFTRRLRIGMRMQTDPTVIYGMGSGYDGNIRRRDLLADTPYNTYTRDDLQIHTPEEALVLASIVEKETGIAEERPMIAGVFTRRLRIGMRMQTDPTVIYGMGSGYDGNIRRRDLLADTPYNTYTRDGL